MKRLARRHGVVSLKLFGSAIRTDFRPGSDVDVIVRHRPEVQPSLEALSALEHDLEQRFGRDVDLVREQTLDPHLLGSLATVSLL